jgi:hypothetical protein
VKKIQERVAEEKRKKEEAKKEKEQKLFQMQSDSLLDADDLAVSVFDVAGSEDNIIIEGSLIKRNWYNKLQLRHF